LSRCKIELRCFNGLTTVVGSTYHGRFPVQEPGLGNRPEEVEPTNFCK
jgi:hypothetical protein